MIRAAPGRAGFSLPALVRSLGTTTPFAATQRSGTSVFVVFRGRTYKDQPTWLTVPYFLWSRLQRELGLRADTAPLLAVIATPSCDAERLPWGRLG